MTKIKNIIYTIHYKFLLNFIGAVTMVPPAFALRLWMAPADSDDPELRDYRKWINRWQWVKGTKRCWNYKKVHSHVVAIVPLCSQTHWRSRQQQVGASRSFFLSVLFCDSCLSSSTLFREFPPHDVESRCWLRFPLVLPHHRDQANLEMFYVVSGFWKWSGAALIPVEWSSFGRSPLEGWRGDQPHSWLS